MILNRGILSQYNSYLNSCYGLGLLSQNRYESDLLKEILYMIEGQETAKISEVKVGGQKRFADLARFDSDAPGVG